MPGFLKINRGPADFEVCSFSVSSRRFFVEGSDAASPSPSVTLCLNKGGRKGLSILAELYA